MAVYLSPGVFTNEIDLSLLPMSTGALRPAFIGTATKGPLNVPTLVTTSSQYIDTFGSPSPLSYMGYAVMAFMEEGSSCYVLRVGVEYQAGMTTDLADIAIDTSGSRTYGWGRIPVFKGIDHGTIKFRQVGDGTGTNPAPVVIQAASVTASSFTDADGSTLSAGVVFTDHAYAGCVADTFTILITGNPTDSEGILDGATYTVTDSAGVTASSGTLTQNGTDWVSNAIALHDSLDNYIGITFYVKVTSGGLGINDIATMVAAPDTSELKFTVEGSTVKIATLAAGTYTTVGDGAATDIVKVINNALAGVTAPGCVAVADLDSSGNTVPALWTTTEGEWIQVTGTCAFAAEMGVSQYVYDIPRSYLIGTNDELYTFTSSNNRVVLNSTSGASTVQFDFSISPATNITAAATAAAIDVNGSAGSTVYFHSFALTVPSTLGTGTNHVVIITDLTRMYDQLQLQATFTYVACLRFADEIGVNYPYSSYYRTFSDSRLWLPEAGTILQPDGTILPLSCEIAPVSTQCTLDSDYYDNIVGWFVAQSPGTWINGYTLTLGLFTSGVGDPAGRFVVTLTDQNGAVVDNVQDVTFNPTDTRYIGNVVNAGSPIGGVNGNSYYQWEQRPTFVGTDTNRVPSAFANKVWTGGEDGIPTGLNSAELDKAIIGNPALSTGLYAFQNPEAYDFNLLLIPGIVSGPVIAQAIQFSENRGDVLYLVDPPFGLRPQQVIDWSNGLLTADLAAALNTSYAALYWSWLQVSDNFNGGTIWIPPSGSVAAVFARTARVAEQWFPPAGINRGQLLSALDVEYNPTQGERDALYGSGNAVNPIVNFTQQGIVVWGQRTLQRQATALDRVNVRMLLIYLKKTMSLTLRSFVFEQNDSATRSQVVHTLNPLLADVAARRGLYAYKVVCDETNNTPERIDRNELWVSVFIQPTRAIEFIVLNLVVLPTGANFGAQEVLAAGGVVTA